METVMLQAGSKRIEGYVFMPQGAPRGAVVVFHEAFGVTPHIKRVCEDYAGQGYAVIAPAMLGLALGKPEGKVMALTKAGLDEARALIEATDAKELKALVEACVAWGKAQGLKVGVVGYCWGGSVAYTAASLVAGIAACSCYYGGRIHELCREMQPQCPALVHLAKLDRYIPFEAAEANLKQYDPKTEVHAYEADHGFNRDDGVTYDAGCAMVARRLTLDLFAKNLA